MSKRNDLTGLTFGSWTAILLDRTDGHRTWWIARCSCGAERSIRADSLRGGGTMQCTACQRRAVGAGNATHGKSRTPEWRIWRAMRGRCFTPTAGGYEDYGARGISVCDRWSDFGAFIADMGPRPSPAHSIERRDVNASYGPENCYWATSKVQGRNKRNTVWLEANGKRQSISDWADEVGIKLITLYKRHVSGWSDHDVVNTPVLAKTARRRRHQSTDPAA